MSQNKLFNVYIFNEIESRGVINGKAGKAAALHNFSDMLTLSQPRGADYAHPLVLPCQKKICDYAPAETNFTCCCQQEVSQDRYRNLILVTDFRIFFQGTDTCLVS